MVDLELLSAGGDLNQPVGSVCGAAGGVQPGVGHLPGASRGVFQSSTRSAGEGCLGDAGIPHLYDNRRGRHVHCSDMGCAAPQPYGQPGVGHAASEHANDFSREDCRDCIGAVCQRGGGKQFYRNGDALRRSAPGASMVGGATSLSSLLDHYGGGRRVRVLCVAGGARICRCPASVHDYFLRVSSLLQVAAFFLVLAVYFLTPGSSELQLNSQESQRLIQWLPSFWFLALLQKLNRSG